MAYPPTGEFPGVPGYPGYDYNSTDLAKWVPWVWSMKTVEKFYPQAIASYTASTDYEGEIKSMGSKVVIATVPTVSITGYQRGGTVKWQTLVSPSVELDINQGASYAFKFDKVDLKQFALNMMDKSSNDAAMQMKTYIDYLYLNQVYADASASNIGATAGVQSASYNMGVAGAAIALSKSNITDKLMEAEGVLDEQNIPDSNRWIVLPTWAKILFQNSDLKNSSFSGQDKSFLVTGDYLTHYGKFAVYSSNLYAGVTGSGSDSTATCYQIIFGHKSGPTFATQLVENEYHEKFENTFGSGMKGLQVWGWQVIKPESVGVMYAKKST